jgi:hypothetical protein
MLIITYKANMDHPREGMTIAAASSNSLETSRELVQVITLEHEEEKKMKGKLKTHRRWKLSILLSLSSFALLLLTTSAQAQTQIIEPIDEGAALALPTPTPTCTRTIKADVVALDQAIMLNRLGAMNPYGMIYALKQDVVAIDSAKGLVTGNVRLRSDKRPRPIVLRMNSGDCLRVTFTNLLSSSALKDQPATRTAGVHVNGMELVNIGSDGSNVGNNPPSLVPPGSSTVYTLTAKREGNNLMTAPPPLQVVKVMVVR